MKRISLLGSTGSIGVNTLNVIRHLGEGFQIVALAAHSNIDKLEEQAKEFNPELIAVYDARKAKELRKRLPNQKIVFGIEGIKEAASLPSANFVVSAMVGSLGLIPTESAIIAGKDVGLANKEALVSGGELIMRLAKEKNVRLLPIDSEHSAIFQCLNGEKKDAVSRIILTASGGPFRNMPLEALNEITPEEALKHPNWKMGPKITIDCSTLMNKGLEMIEARWLFGIPPEKIEVIVHPESIIHSMVEFCDGSMMAQMSLPNMVLPIQYALTFPERRPGLTKPFDFIQHKRLEFSLPDFAKFRCLKLTYDSLKIGGSMPCFMNAANEVLVNSFLERKIRWMEIAELLESLMQDHEVQGAATLEEIMEVDQQARRAAELLVNSSNCLSC